MKKLGIFAVLAVFGVGAFAASVGVPWYVDNASIGARIPQKNFIGTKRGVVTGIVSLKSNRTDTLECSITYYNSAGADLGPAYPNNTFTIAPLSALAFRPNAVDPGSSPGGQEGPQGVLVPDNPAGTTLGQNGSLVISWVGGDKDVQGQVAYYQTSIHPNDSPTAADPRLLTYSYAHLLPPGV